MTITFATARQHRRPAREYWHRKFIWAARIAFADDDGQFDVRFETVLRRWSNSRRAWLYLRATPQRVANIIGTRRRVELRCGHSRKSHAPKPAKAETFPLPIEKRAELLEKMGPQ